MKVRLEIHTGILGILIFRGTPQNPPGLLGVQ